MASAEEVRKEFIKANNICPYCKDNTYPETRVEKGKEYKGRRCNCGAFFTPKRPKGKLGLVNK